MRRFCALFAAVLLSRQALTQAVEPSAPPKIVSKHAQDVLSSDGGSACENACAQIALNLSAERMHFTPNDINYIWSAQQGELVPACRFEPLSAEEVSLILGIVKKAQCHFAIKSGGHSQHPGASTAADGVTIDLVRMNKVAVSADRESVQVGAGAVWLDVFTAVEAEGLLVVGGRVADVGVGGLLTGGGLSLLSNRYGWGCDNVLSFEVVLPDGSLTAVDQAHHPELYRALRGAGFSNFGIITSFTLETIVPANPMGFWNSFTVFGTDHLPTLLDEQHSLLSQKVDVDLDSAYLHCYGWDQAHDSRLAIVMQIHASHADANTYPDIFKYASRLEPVMEPSVKVLPYSNFTKMLYETNPRPGKRNLYVSFSHRPSREMDEKMTSLFYSQVISKIRNVTGIIPNMVMQPIFANARRQTTKRGGNALNLAGEDETLNLVLFPWTWDLAEDDDLIYDTMKEMLATGEAWAKELDVYHPYIYVNYAGPWQDIWRGYGEENVKLLKQLQRRYDPEGIFTTGGLASGYFKLNTKDDVFTESDKPENGEKDEL